MSNDEEKLHSIADTLESRSWLDLVAEKYAEQRGIPLTENLGRQIVAHLRNNMSVEIKTNEPKPN